MPSVFTVMLFAAIRMQRASVRREQIWPLLNKEQRLPATCTVRGGPPVK